jgi:hypothetical protein
MKWQGKDIKLKRVPPRGSFSSTQDFPKMALALHGVNINRVTSARSAIRYMVLL